MDDSGNVRYKNLIRLLVVLSMNRGTNFADRADQLLGQLSDDELMSIFYGEKHEIANVMRKYRLPMSVMDLIGILIDGEPLSALVADPSKTMVGPVPPRKQMH